LVYNSLLNERAFLYETTGRSISQYAQEKHFTQWKDVHPELKEVHAHLLQNAALRVNLAYSAFFRRFRSGEKPGYPRFKGKGQYDSLGFKEWGAGGICFRNGNLRVSKIGEIKGRFHRDLPGTPKTATIRRQAGKWFVCIACECEPEALPVTNEAVGIDVGLNQFAALSDCTFIGNPRFFRRDEAALAKAGRKQAKTPKRSRARRKANKVLSRIHERIRNRRQDFCHQNSRRIVNQFGVIAVEKLNVKNMSRSPAPKQDEATGEYLPNGSAAKAGLNKSISDASWSFFRQCLAYKAASAGRVYMEMNPAYTSQDCHACGFRAKKKLSERWHNCPICGASLDRDTNAAINILKLCGTTQSGRHAGQEAVPL
jgi:putative transposase